MSTPPGNPSPWQARDLMANHSSRDWVDEAACAQTDPEIFFPTKGGSVIPAKIVCLRCDVRAQCLEYAVTSPTVLDGIWGGTTPKERQQMRKRRGVRTQVETFSCGTEAGYRRHLRHHEVPCSLCRRAEARSRADKAAGNK